MPLALGTVGIALGAYVVSSSYDGLVRDAGIALGLTSILLFLVLLVQDTVPRSRRIQLQNGLLYGGAGLIHLLALCIPPRDRSLLVETSLRGFYLRAATLPRVAFWTIWYALGIVFHIVRIWPVRAAIALATGAVLGASLGNVLRDTFGFRSPTLPLILTITYALLVLIVVIEDRWTKGDK